MIPTRASSAIIHGMGKSMRRVIGMILMVLLPLQAMASVLTHSCANDMPDCPAMKVKMASCCEHAGLLNNKASTDSSMPDHSAPAGHPSMSSCGMSTTCDVPMPMATLPSSQPVLFHPGRQTAPQDIAVSFLSFIPDSPQRPPCLLA